MADSKEIVKGLLKEQGVSFPVLIPNIKGKQQRVGVGIG